MMRSMSNVLCFDLDDTLYKEINYLKAAYKIIAKEAFGEQMEIYYNQMLSWYYSKEDVFQRVVEISPQNINKDDLLDIYRYGVHNLSLPIEIHSVLDELKERKCNLGLITDGRSLTQRNKISALGLFDYFKEENIVISEEFGSEKPSLSNYKYFMNRYPNYLFYYVGDNPKKDYVGANQLGWETICLIDDGSNIHKQEFDSLDSSYQPKYKIHKFPELLNII